MKSLLSRAGVTAIASALFVAIVAYVPTIASGHISRDSGVFLYTGMVVSRGGMPYVDSWDHKGPLLPLIEAIAWRLGTGITGAAVLEAVTLFLGLAISGLIWARVVGHAAAPIVLLVGVTYLAVFEGGNFTETWLFPFQLVAYSSAAYVALHSGRSASSRAVALLGVVTGTALAVGLFTRMNNVVGLALVLIVGTVFLRRRIVFASAAMAVVGIMGAGLVLWLWTGDALRAGIDQYLRYNFFYSGGAAAGERLAAFGILSQLLVSGAVVAAMLALAAAWLARRGVSRATSAEPNVVVALFMVVGGADSLSQLVSGRPYPHYLVVATAGFAVAVVVLASRLLPATICRRTNGSESLARGIVAVGVVLLVVSSSLVGAAQGLRIAVGTGVFVTGSYQAQLVDRVVSETTVDDRVLVHGAETWILAAAGRLSPTSITYSLPVEQGYGGLPAEYLAEVTAFPPALIVESPTSCGISVECPPEKANFAGLAPFVAATYTLEGEVDGFRFWTRNDG